MNYVEQFSVNLRERLEKAKERANKYKECRDAFYIEECIMNIEFCKNWLDLIDSEIKKPASVSACG